MIPFTGEEFRFRLISPGCAGFIVNDPALSRCVVDKGPVDDLGLGRIVGAHYHQLQFAVGILMLSEDPLPPLIRQRSVQNTHCG